MEQTDKAFVQFTTLAYGYRAAWRVMESYWKHFRDERKLFTPRTILQRWAPPSENDTEAYLRSVCRLSGLGGNENMPRPRRARKKPGDMDKMLRLLTAMTCVECGISPCDIPVEEIVKGEGMAWSG